MKMSEGKRRNPSLQRSINVHSAHSRRPIW